MNFHTYTVIIAAYNAEEYLERAISSALNLNPIPDEIIIVDDASTDSTSRVIEKFVSANQTVKFLKHKMNLGPSAARNSGIAMAKNEICLIMDSDDESIPERASEHLSMHNNGADLTYVSSRKRYATGHGFTAQNDETFCKRIEPKSLLARLLGLSKHVDSHRYFVPSCTMSIKKSLFTKMGGFDADLRRNEDADLAIRAAFANALFSFSSKEYVLRHDSVSELKGGYIDVTNERALLLKYRMHLTDHELNLLELKSDFRELYFRPSLKALIRVLKFRAVIFLLQNLPTLVRRLLHDLKKGS